jgi:crotonobetainyl-CoA:carnitine CoA-transferase CaiB-like acyl-CoA transferase
LNELTDGTVCSVDAVTAAAIGPYRKSRPRRCNNIARVVGYLRVIAYQAVVEIAHPYVRKVQIVGAPVRLWETPDSARAAAPIFGEHTDEMPRDVLGLDPGEMAQLRAAGAIGPERWIRPCAS